MSAPAVAVWIALLAVPPRGPTIPIFLDGFWGAWGVDMYTWRTREDGVIAIRETTEGPERILTLSGPEAELAEHVEARWGDLCRRIGGWYGLPPFWMQSFIQRESGGNEHARNPESKPGAEDDGVGLGQITAAALKKGYTDRQLEIPEVNLDIMAKYMAELVKRYGVDFPKISAAYNAGSVHPPLKGFENPWGMHCTPGHITAEVAALNYLLLRPLPDDVRAQTLALVFATSDEYARHDFERGPSEEAPATLRDRPTLRGRS